MTTNISEKVLASKTSLIRKMERKAVCRCQALLGLVLLCTAPATTSFFHEYVSAVLLITGIILIYNARRFFKEKTEEKP